MALFTFGLHNKIEKKMYVPCFTQGSFSYFATKRHIFRLAELNTFTA